MTTVTAKDDDLIAYGYAPGNYMSGCVDCEQQMTGVDKRCFVCKPCAEKRRDKKTAAAAAQKVTTVTAQRLTKTIEELIAGHTRYRQFLETDQGAEDRENSYWVTIDTIAALERLQALELEVISLRASYAIISGVKP